MSQASNDNQQFLAHFDWFLSIFQISDVKPELSPVKLKVRKNGIFWAKNLFQNFFSRLFLSPNQSYVKNWVKMAFKLVFIGGGGFESQTKPIFLSVSNS